MLGPKTVQVNACKCSDTAVKLCLEYNSFLPSIHVVGEGMEEHVLHVKYLVTLLQFIYAVCDHHHFCIAISTALHFPVFRCSRL